MGDSETLLGTIDRITFHNEETGYTVARLLLDSGHKNPITIVGEIPGASIGLNVEITGEWATHPQYGKQFTVARHSPVTPTTTEGIERYLGSGLIKGVGPATAKKIVAQFGKQALEVIEKSPERLSEIEGLGKKRISSIQKGWNAQVAIKDLAMFLATHSVGTTYAVRIHKHYGDRAVHEIETNPYRLADDIWGIGFLTADRIAQNLGIPSDSPKRIDAAVRYLLKEATSEGHTYLLTQELVERTAQSLEIDPDPVPLRIENAVARGQIVVVEHKRICLPVLDEAERVVADWLRRRIAAGVGTAQHTATVEALDGVRYTTAQQQAISMAQIKGAMVLTGGPGTGKTTATRGIIHALSMRGLRIALCAPTGRAAKRLSEATGMEASTIHRLLGYGGEDGFSKNGDDQLEFDVVMVDEVSMVDIWLMAGLMLALKPTAQLVLVGDADQLPSVGPGNVLRDIIDSGTVPVVRLATIFRQDQTSNIVAAAHEINAGALPVASNRKDDEFFFLEEDDPEAAADTIIDLIAHRLPKSYGLNPMDEIQVLSPMYRGQTGVSVLNSRIQEALNPDQQAVHRAGVEFRIGDKVIVTRNNYEKGVFNGDMGTISQIYAEEQTILLKPSASGIGDEVVYEFDEMDELALGYAVTVHRSQGSEFPAVIMPVSTQHYVMLQRNLLYTGLTRAKRLAVLVGTKKALGIAVNQAQVAERYTWLRQRLQEVE